MLQQHLRHRVAEQLEQQLPERPRLHLHLQLLDKRIQLAAGQLLGFMGSCHDIRITLTCLLVQSYLDDAGQQPEKRSHALGIVLRHDELSRPGRSIATRLQAVAQMSLCISHDSFQQRKDPPAGRPRRPHSASSTGS